MKTEITPQAKKIIEDTAKECWPSSVEGQRIIVSCLKAAITDPELLKAQGLCNEWVRVEDRLPNEADTSDELYNEVQTLQIGRARVTLMKWWEVKSCPFTKFWLPITPYPAKPWYDVNPLLPTPPNT